MSPILFIVLFVAICNGEPQPQGSPYCKSRNGYVPVEGSCDAYLECLNFEARQMQCPDGLRFNPTAVWPAYPCGYPMDVSCQGRGALQAPNPTAECPNQYGFFPSANANGDCGIYRMCVAGNAIDMMCPPGLAFNPESARCDWPDQVPSCDVEAFIGFKCPEIPVGSDGKPLDAVMNYKYEPNCLAFYSCEAGRARLLTCDDGYAFDAAAGRCEDIDKVACYPPQSGSAAP